MGGLIAFLLVIALALFIFGLLAEVVQFLIWVALGLAAVAGIMALVRYIKGKGNRNSNTL
ncbi:membrane protein [Microbacterium phage Pumpernickel]|uniref:Membrane protein n=1 Tax=Microbacterium phage Pumpernickel TaxID=2885983 RepID=A0AAE8Y764_9CAUD|nr:membrane protein [Microbacterium phage Pumpernickel]UDL15915.1 membrane protein [Microbacterium phage Pumpernickel]